MTSEEKISQVVDCLIELRYFTTIIEKNFKKDLKDNNINICEFLYLLLLDQDNYTMSELSSLAKVDKSLTTRVIKDLEKKNYIYRDTTNLSARKYKIKLTDIGKDKIKTIHSIILKARKHFIDGFTEKELKVIEEAFIILRNKGVEIKNAERKKYVTTKKNNKKISSW